MVLRPRPVEHACTSSSSDMTSSPSRCPHPKQYFFCPVKKKEEKYDHQTEVYARKR